MSLERDYNYYYFIIRGDKMGIFKSCKTFFLFFIGQTISQLGTSLTSFAIVIWAFTQKGEAMASSLLAICNMVPYVIVSLVGGSVTDRVNKKKIMLICDFIAAVGSLLILLCFQINVLELWVLCIINAINGFMNAFQSPASQVATTLLIPKEHYVRIGGIQSTVSSLMGIFTPMIAAGVLAFGGLGLILAIDLSTFVFAFLTLLFFVKVPEKKQENQIQSVREILNDTKEGLLYLKQQTGILMLFIFFSVFNFVGAIAFNALLSPMILARTGNNEIQLGAVMTAMSISGVVSGLLVTVMKPAKRRVSVMLSAIIVAFTGIAAMGIAQNVYLWATIMFLCCLGIPFYFTYETAIIRETVPVEKQGRIFAAKGMLSQILMPVGYLVGALLADKLFEPMMKGSGVAQELFSKLVGTGAGSGMGLIFVISGVAGVIFTLLLSTNKHVRQFNKPVTTEQKTTDAEY